MRRFAQRTGMGLLACALGSAGMLAQGWQHIGNVRSVEKLRDGVEFTAGTVKVRITVFREGIFRVRVAPDGVFPKDSSWAVIETPEPPAFKIEENSEEIRIIAGPVVALVRRSPLLISFTDAAGIVFWQTSQACQWPGTVSGCTLGKECLPMNTTTASATRPAP